MAGQELMALDFSERARAAETAVFGDPGVPQCRTVQCEALLQRNWILEDDESPIIKFRIHAWVVADSGQEKWCGAFYRKLDHATDFMNALFLHLNPGVEPQTYETLRPSGYFKGVLL